LRKKIETPRPKETHEKRDLVTRHKNFRDSEIGSRISEIHDFLGTIRHPFFTDNENASRIVSVGSLKQHLQCLALDIFQLCLVNEIQIDAQWIPRDANVRADLLSRFVDQDVWSLNCEIFAQLDSRWGPLSVHRFASHYNAQLRRFNSHFCRRAVVQSMVCPRIGMVKTIGSVHQCL